MNLETIEVRPPVPRKREAGASTVDVPSENRRGRSIRFRLASLVMACVLPVWAAAGILVYYNYQSRRAITEQRMLETARALTAVVDRELENMQAGLDALATSKSLATGDLPEFYVRAHAVRRAFPGSDIILSDAHDQELIHTFLPYGASLPKRAVPDTVRQVYETGRPIISGPYKGAGTGRLQIAVDVPVFRNGRVAYDLAMVTPVQRFAAILSQQHLPPEWIGGIYNANRIMISRTRLAKEFVGRTPGPGLSQRMNETAEGTGDVINFEGIPIIDSFSRSRASGWTVVIGVPNAHVIADIWRWLWWSIVGTALLSLTGIALAQRMAAAIARSIQGLVAPALALGCGESVKIGHLSLAEADEVGQSLMKASDLIQQRAEERARAEAARRETEALKKAQAALAQLARIVETTEEAIISLSVDGRVLSWNRGAERLLGYSAAERVGQSINIVIPEDCKPQYENVRTTVAAGKSLEAFETFFMTKSAERKPVSLTISPMQDESERVVGVSVIARDLTQIKKAQQLEEQFRQAQKLEAVGRLTGGVAHDFNNLLLVISSYTEMLQAQLAPDDPLRRNTQEVLNAAGRAASLTRQLLAFSRKQVLSPQVLDLNAVIDDTAKMIKRLIGEDIELTFLPAKPLWPVTADPGQITQVLMNLCVNARDAMPQGGKLTIETQNVFVDARTAGKHPNFSVGEYAMVAISDTGTGMTKEVQERIFEPFFTTKEKGKGTGLGLSTVYGIIKQSGGYIWVYSEVGNGSSFKLYFPRAGKSIATVAPQVSSTTEGSSEIVLLVEDEASLREIIREYLTKRGYLVLEAANGQEALELADHHEGHIDLLLTDVIMPKMGGPELARMLESRHSIATLFMSGYTDDAIVAHGVLESGTAFIQKPFSLHALAEKVRGVIDASGIAPKQTPNTIPRDQEGT